MKKVAIVVPVYNVEQYIERCLNSVIVQTHTKLEIILVDDGSTDNSGKICDDYAKKDKRIKVLHKKNGGLSSARNEGIKIVTADYITFVDSDDYIDSDYIEYMYNLLINSDAKIATCQFKIVRDGRLVKTNNNLNKRVYNNYQAIEEMLYGRNPNVSANAKIYLTELFDGITYPTGKVSEDTFTTYKLFDKCDKIVIGNEAKYYYMIRNNSITRTKFNIRKLDQITAYEEIYDYLNMKYPENNDLILSAQRGLAFSRLSVLRQIVNCDDRDKAMESKLKKEIIPYKWQLLKNSKVSIIDKFALITLLLGVPVFKLSWNLYSILTNRK